MQGPHPHTFHMAKVHRICHGLVIHPLHGLTMKGKIQGHDQFILYNIFPHKGNVTYK